MRRYEDCATSTRPRLTFPGWWRPPPKSEPFIIAKAGKPLVKVIAVEAPAAPKRFDFMKGQFTVPDDFDTMGQEEIETLFYGDK